MRKILSVLTMTTMLSLPVAAQATEYSFDTDHSKIFFKVSHLGFSYSIGEFTEFDGTLNFDPEKPEEGSVEVTIPVKDLEMGSEKWNAHLLNEDFFTVEKYPEMTFKSTAIEVTGEKTGKVIGDLTIMDVTKPVTLDVTFHKAGKHPFGDKEVAGFSATADIKRSEFGMEYGLPNVGDDVHIMIEIEAVKK